MNERSPDLSLFLDILHALEAIDAPYMIIGAFPLTMSPTDRLAFQRRVRQRIELPNAESFEVWCARPEDVIVGKLKAWAEGRSRKHETDIYEMLVFHYLGRGATQTATLDEAYVDSQAMALEQEVAALWQTIKEAAQREAHRGMAWFTRAEFAPRGRVWQGHANCARVVAAPSARSSASAWRPIPSLRLGDGWSKIKAP